MARETFIDPAGRPFEIDTGLLGDSCVKARMNERRWWGLREMAAEPERAPQPPTRMCLHGNRAAYCHRCGADYCACPGQLPHQCKESP